MWDYKKFFRNREFRLKLIQALRFIPDRPYLKLVYWLKTGQHLNLEKPVTFCDKLNWLKLYNQHPEYTQLVDKIAVHDYLRKQLGEDIGLPMLGFWKHYDEIDFDALPEQFVLKCNHDSGSVKVIRDKQKINHAEFRAFFEDRLKRNPFPDGREYPYKKVTPRILAEKYMTPPGEADINDYKFFCFNGKPEILFVATERSCECKFDFFDMDFKHLDITNIHPQCGHELPKPECFNEMKMLAARLAKGMAFVRIDLYQIQGKVYFGEFTFFHAGGFWPLHPHDWEIKLGNMIQITPPSELKSDSASDASTVS